MRGEVVLWPEDAAVHCHVLGELAEDFVGNCQEQMESVKAMYTTE